MRAAVVAAYLGAVLRVVGLVLLAPAAAAALWGEPASVAASYLAASAAAMACWLLSRRPLEPPTVKETMAVCALSWVAVSAAGAIPLALAGGMAPLDAFFEAVSGFTTTGLTLVPDPSALPRSLLLWRALTQWLGGMGILTFFIAVVVPSSASAFQLHESESRGIESGRLKPGLLTSIRALLGIYAGLTLAAAVAFALLGMGPFDALAHALTVASTGGFSTRAGGLSAFPPALVPAFLLFMLLGGVNFQVVHKSVTRGRLEWDGELAAYALIIAVASVLVWADLRAHEPGADGALGTAVFHAASATSAGFSTRDMASFPPLSRAVFVALMALGACECSTGGGLKVVRVVLLARLAGRELYRLRVPRRAVAPVCSGGRPIPEGDVSSIAGMLVLYLAAFGAGTLVVIASTGAGPFEAASGMAAALGNVSVTFLPVSASLPAAVKLTYIFGMLAGRLEILPLLVLADPRTWRRFPG